MNSWYPLASLVKARPAGLLEEPAGHRNLGIF